MEATPANVSNTFETHMVEPSGPGVPAVGISFNFYADLMATCDNKRQSNPKSQHLQQCLTDQTGGAGPMMQVPTSPPGVSNCYIFKSRLQEYAQKVGLPTPVYETIKEGPSHQPSFKSTVIVGGVRYDSLPEFLNRKAAEQSAAEIALMELSKCGQSKESISVPVHETGLCKNLLQDYTQKMNYAIPTYICKKDETPNKTLPFSCTVEIGGIRYIGASAKTRKEAEIKAARTALLAIQSSTSVSSDNLSSKSHHMVVPPKRKAPDTDLSLMTGKPKKPKRSRFKKKRHNPKHHANVSEQIPPQNMDILGSNDAMGSSVVVEKIQNGLSDVQVTGHGGNVSEQSPPEDMDVLASNDDIEIPVEVQQVQSGLCDVQVLPDYEQTPHSLASSFKDTNKSLKIYQRDGEASHIEGSSVPQDDRCQDSGINQGDQVPSIEVTNHERENTAGTNVGLVIADPPANLELGPLVSETEVSMGEPEPALADTNHEREENTVGPVIADRPANQEFGPPVSETEVSPGEPEPALADTNHEREENTAGKNVGPVIADPPANQELGPPVSETEVSQGEPEPALADKNREREENTAGTNVGPVIADSRANQELGPPVLEPKISPGEPELAMAEDRKQEREDYENDAGVNGA